MWKLWQKKRMRFTGAEHIKATVKSEKHGFRSSIYGKSLLQYFFDES